MKCPALLPQNAVATPDTEVETDAATDSRLKYQPPYHVILLNDDDHSYEYVITMLKDLFGHPVEKGFKLAKQVDESGRAVEFRRLLRAFVTICESWRPAA